MKNRIDLIDIFGSDYLQANIENSEFSYLQDGILKSFIEDNELKHYKLDIRFEHENSNISLLVETKTNKLTQKDIKQLKTYFELEKEYRPGRNIICYLLNLKDENDLYCFKYNAFDNEEQQMKDCSIRRIYEYLDEFNDKTNDREKIIKNTLELNDLLHKYDINESIRPQFVGSILIVLNSDEFNLSSVIANANRKTDFILDKMIAIINKRLSDDANQNDKIKVISNILNEQQVKELSFDHLIHLIKQINNGIIPFINEDSNAGEDLLNLFFTTFNKYVQKKDKNQAFTPSHITDFMCEIVDLNQNSKVLDPTCGSGAFLVQAMTKMLKKVTDTNIRDNIKRNQIFGIEQEEVAFGLASTNMLIHKDGKSNIVLDNCFRRKQWITDKNINVVLMNPPFNGKKFEKDAPTRKSDGMDATKGFYFVYENVKCIKTPNAKLATILPLSVAIGTDKVIDEYKQKMLKEHTLKAVFTLPNDIFHPGASASACVMLFELNKPHNSKFPTFFGYYKEDGFVKKKNLGRIEKTDWNTTKEKWLKAFRNNQEIDGFSVLHSVGANDEWLAEAYMKTDYSTLCEDDFIKTIREYIAFKVKEGIE